MTSSLGQDRSVGGRAARQRTGNKPAGMRRLASVPGCADAAFPVVGVQTLLSVGEVPDDGAVVVGRGVSGHLDDKCYRGGLLPGCEDLAGPCFCAHGQMLLPEIPHRAVRAGARPSDPGWAPIDVLKHPAVIEDHCLKQLIKTARNGPRS